MSNKKSDNKTSDFKLSIRFLKDSIKSLSRSNSNNSEAENYTLLNNIETYEKKIKELEKTHDEMKSAFEETKSHIEKKKNQLNELVTMIKDHKSKRAIEEKNMINDIKIKNNNAHIAVCLEKINKEINDITNQKELLKNYIEDNTDGDLKNIIEKYDQKLEILESCRKNLKSEKVDTGNGTNTLSSLKTILII